MMVMTPMGPVLMMMVCDCACFASLLLVAPSPECGSLSGFFSACALAQLPNGMINGMTVVMPPAVTMDNGVPTGMPPGPELEAHQAAARQADASSLPVYPFCAGMPLAPLPCPLERPQQQQQQEQQQVPQGFPSPHCTPAMVPPSLVMMPPPAPDSATASVDHTPSLPLAPQNQSQPAAREPEQPQQPRLTRDGINKRARATDMPPSASSVSVSVPPNDSEDGADEAERPLRRRRS